MSEAFKVRINDGAAFDFETDTGKYCYAALAAVLADDDLLPLPDRETEAVHVEIWCEALAPDYGPYHFLIWEVDQNIRVRTAIPKVGST